MLNKILNWMTKNGAFILTLLALCLSFYLALNKDADVGTLFPTLLGIFVGSTTSRAVSSHWASSKDPNSDSTETIKSIEGIETPPK